MEITINISLSKLNIQCPLLFIVPDSCNRCRSKPHPFHESVFAICVLSIASTFGVGDAAAKPALTGRNRATAAKVQLTKNEGRFSRAEVARIAPRRRAYAPYVPRNERKQGSDGFGT